MPATTKIGQATAFAPASAANVAIGFDILGFSVDVLGDKCTVTRTDQPGVTISGSSGVVKDIPREPERNTAGRALLAHTIARVASHCHRSAGPIPAPIRTPVV